MSFILDALRKSEARRRMGQAPGLVLTPADTLQRRRTASWRIPALAMVALILVGFGLFAGRFLYWQPAPPAVTTPEDDARAVAVAEPLEVVPEEPASDPEPAPAPRAAVATTAARPDPATDPDTPDSPPVAETPAVAVVAPAEEVFREPEEEEIRPGREVRGYVQRWELPLNVRRDLPALNLTIHVFSADPDSRFVLVNGERYVEGDQLAPGVSLVSILREGAVVDFRDHRFLLAP